MILFVIVIVMVPLFLALVYCFYFIFFLASVTKGLQTLFIFWRNHFFTLLRFCIFKNLDCIYFFPNLCFSFYYFEFPMICSWPNIWPILETVSCADEKNVQSAAFACHVLSISVRCIWCVIPYKSSVSQWFFFFLFWMTLPLMERKGWNPLLLLYWVYLLL